MVAVEGLARAEVATAVASAEFAAGVGFAGRKNNIEIHREV